MQDSFRYFAQRASDAAGSPWAFFAALTLIQLEAMSDAELEALENEFQRVRGSRRKVPQVADPTADAAGGSARGDRA